MDIQKPLAFGKERAAAEALGATFRWPFMTREVTAEGLVGADGTLLLPAQTVIISIGDVPNLPFLPESVQVVWWAARPGSGQRRADPRRGRRGAAGPGHQRARRGQARRYLLATQQGRALECPSTKQLIRYENLTFAHYDPVSDPRPDREGTSRRPAA